MSGFDFNPFEVGNPMTLGLAEESLVEDIRKLQSESRYHRIIAMDVDNLFATYGVRYQDLPQWIKDEVDLIDLDE